MSITTLQFAARIAADEGYTRWDKVSKTKRAKYEKRARAYIDLVLGGKLEPIWAGAFATFEDWVNTATQFLKSNTDVDANGMHLAAVCVDTEGRRCVSGGDFMRARDEKKFPVRFFFRMIDRDTLATNTAWKNGEVSP